MSGANAISGITIVGALIIAGRISGWISTVLGFIAIVLRDDERGGRLRCHRPHARDVQDAKPEEKR